MILDEFFFVNWEKLKTFYQWEIATKNLINGQLGVLFAPNDPTQKSEMFNLPNSDCSAALPATYVSGVDVASFREAIASIKSAGSGSYKTIGSYICNFCDRNCSRALSRYQFAWDRMAGNCDRFFKSFF